jgi:V/A-type H+-transporting ATPase subunit E
MTEELQSLLERIQKDGIEKAEAQGEEVIAEAKRKADAIIKEADRMGAELLEKAERESGEFGERANRAIEQAARDVVLWIGNALTATLEKLVGQEVSEAMTGDTLKQMLTRVVETYCGAEEGETAVQVLLNPDQQQEVRDFFMSRFAERMRKGLEVAGDETIVRGFRVRAEAGHVEHDFSAEAVTEALCQLLRPRLAEIVRESLGTQKKAPAEEKQA